MNVAAEPAARPRVSIRPLDRFEAGALLVLFALACAPLAGLLLRVWTQGGVVTGGDGFLVADPLQYLTWLREAGEHVGVANLYDLDDGPAAFVHPGVLLSGLAHRLGLGVVAAYMIWKPVAVLALFAAAVALTRRFLDRRDDRRLALVLALFSASPVAALVGWSRRRRQRGQVRLRLPLRRAVAGHLPVGLPVHGDRGRPAPARPARLRARPRGGLAPGARRRRRARPGGGLAAAVAGRDAHPGAGGHRGAEPAARARRAAERSATWRLRSPRPPPRSSTTSCSRARTRPGSSRARSTTSRAGRGG